jgi:hypothetical protein
VLEFRYHRDVERAHDLPESSRQVAFTGSDGRRGRRDCVYEGYQVVVELDGRRAHPVEAQWKDRARDNAAAVDGQQSLRYSWKTSPARRAVRRPKWRMYSACEAGRADPSHARLAVPSSATS